MGFGLGFGVCGLGFRGQDLVFRGVRGLRFRETLQQAERVSGSTASRQAEDSRNPDAHWATVRAVLPVEVVVPCKHSPFKP